MAKKKVPLTNSVVFRFDMTNPRAAQHIEQMSGGMISRITAETKEMVRKVVAEGYSKGSHPNSIALDLVGRINKATGRREGGVIGMSAPQESAAANLYDRLFSGEPSEMRKVLGMALRDKRFDSTIEKAIENEEAIPTELIDRMYERYVDNAVKLRGEAISRTETGEAVYASQSESLKQGLEKTGYTEESIVRTWRTTGDGKVRDSHADMDGQEVKGLSQPFVSGDGNEMMFPMDGSLGADAGDLINCRCDIDVDVDFSQGIDLSVED